MGEENHEKRQVKFSLTGGISLILLMFIVLLFVSFASMSISAGRADLRLSDKYEQSVTGYYTGRNAAQEYLSSLEEQLAEACRNAGSIGDYGSAVEKLAEDSGAQVTMAQAQDSSQVGIQDSSQADAGGSAAGTTVCTLTRTFPAGENMELLLAVDVLYPASPDGPLYTILSEKTQSTSSFDYDENLNVITR